MTMIGLGIFIVVLLVVAHVARFIDNVILRDAQKKQLLQKFENWWLTVQDYDKMQLALAFASKTNDAFNYTFGQKLFSRRVVYHCSIISSGILLLTLSLLHQPFGVTPWKNYRESIKSVLAIADDLTSTNDIGTLRQYDLNLYTPGLIPATNVSLVNINSSLFLFSIKTNGIHRINHVSSIGRGGIILSYQKTFEAGRVTFATNGLGHVTSYTDPVDLLEQEGRDFHLQMSKYDKPFYVVAYSVGYFVALFCINDFLFILSLAVCRTMLREIAASGRIVSALALFFSNLVIVSLSCGILLLLFTVVAIPFFWIFIPVIYAWSEESLTAVIPVLLSAAIAVWILTSGSAKLVVLIAFLPNLIAGVIALFTLIAMKWRNGFHYIMSAILIRCVEKSPIVVLLSIITLITGLFVTLTKSIHIFGFLR